MNHADSSTPPPLTRRRLLATISAFSLTQFPVRAFAAGLDTTGFLTLSQRLVGQDDLSDDIADKMLKAFAALGREDDIAALAAGETDEELANTIVSTWYTGETPDADDPDVFSYTDALVWQAMDYTKPMAFCGGGMGYWADPPET